MQARPRPSGERRLVPLRRTMLVRDIHRLDDIGKWRASALRSSIQSVDTHHGKSDRESRLVVVTAEVISQCTSHSPGTALAIRNTKTQGSYNTSPATAVGRHTKLVVGREMHSSDESRARRAQIGIEIARTDLKTRGSQPLLSGAYFLSLVRSCFLLLPMSVLPLMPGFRRKLTLRGVMSHSRHIH